MPLRELNREQMWLLPPALEELVPVDHPARFVAEFVDALDHEGWAEMEVQMDGDPMGAPAYHPRALLSVWLYGFMTGVRSCRKLETACREQLPYLWLTGWQHPDHNTLWRFYSGHRQGMRSLFKRTVRTALAVGLVDLAVQAVDGTKIRANASGGRNYDAEGLRRLLNKVESKIEDLESQNEAGEEPSAHRLPQELSDQQTLRERVKQAMEKLASSPGLKRINLTDSDARLMKSRQGIVPSFNAQAVVSRVTVPGEASAMLMTAADAYANPDDHAQLIPMLEQAEEITGTEAPLTLADAGYHSGKNLKECALTGRRVIMPDSKRKTLANPFHKDRFVYDEANDSYICPKGQRLRFTRYIQANTARVRLYRASAGVCLRCPAFGECTIDRVHGRGIGIGPHDEILRRHRALMATEEAKRASMRRGQLIEPVFGILKEQMGLRRFHLRGVVNVAAEWTLSATAFNLRTLYRIWRAQAPSHSPIGPQLAPAA